MGWASEDDRARRPSPAERRRHGIRCSCEIAPGVSDRCGTVLINETNNYWDQLAPFGGMKKSGLGRELSDWMFSEITEIKQISIDISKVRE